jgi:hypothetical protein
MVRLIPRRATVWSKKARLALSNSRLADFCAAVDRGLAFPA